MSVRSTLLVLILLTSITGSSILAVPVHASDVDEPLPFRADSFDLVDLTFDELPWTNEVPRESRPPAPTDRSGVPLFRWHLDGELYYRPGGLAINGLKRIDAFRDTGDRAQLDQALLQARALKRIAIKKDDAWWLPFWFD